MRAYQKRVVFLKNTGSEMFEEAYFVIKECGGEADCGLDMVTEAQRIIKESYGRKGRVPRIFGKSFLIPFFTGALFALSASLLVYFAVAL